MELQLSSCTTTFMQISSSLLAGRMDFKGATPVQDNSVLIDRHDLRAAQAFQNAIASGTVPIKQPGLEDVFLADLYRRAGDFQTAQAVVEQSEMRNLECSVAKVLDHVRQLIQRQDIAYHAILKVLEPIRG
ncbi:MAG: hypothetical protein ACRC8A_11980 [Microcoleaceae cyanobacterium]